MVKSILKQKHRQKDDPAAAGSPSKKMKTKGKGKQDDSKEAGEEEDDGDPKQKDQTPSFSIKTNPVDKKPAWAGISDVISLTAKGYRETQLFGEEDTLHEDVRKAIHIYTKKFGMDTAKQMKEIIHPREWHNIFKNALGKQNKLTDTYDSEEKEKLQTLMAKLSRTDPAVFGQAVKGDELIPSNMTTAWEGAKRTLGSDWAVKRPAAKSKPKAAVGFKTLDLEWEEAKRKKRKALKQTELQGLCKHRERFDMKIRPNQEAKKASAGLHEKLQDWFSEVKTIDPTAKIMPWKKGSKAPLIDKPKDIPEDIKALRTYFERVGAGKKHSWTKVQITMDEDPEKITSKYESEMEYWYQDDNDTLHIRPLRDSDDTAEIGYMIYTGNFTNVERFMKMVNDEAKKENFKGTLGGKVKRCWEIEVDEAERIKHKNSKRDAWKVQYWNLLHVIADRAEREQARDVLYEIFNNTNRKLPAGLVTRYIPVKDLATLLPMGIRARTHAFNKHVTSAMDLEVITAREILHMDEPDETTGKTLREFLTTIKSSISGRPLFHNIDRGTGRMDSTTTMDIAVFSEHRSEAEPIAGVLPALCMQRLSPTTKKWFGGGALKRCEGVKFANRGNMFTTKEDGKMKAVDADNFGLNDAAFDEEVEFDFPEELLDETKRDHHKSGRPEDASLYTMDIRNRHGDSESEGTEATSTITQSEAQRVQLKEENESFRAFLLERGLLNIAIGKADDKDDEDMEVEKPGTSGAPSEGTGQPGV